MKKLTIAISLMCSALLFTACAGNTEKTAAAVTAGEMFTERDLDSSYDEASAIRVTLSGNTAESSSDAVQISGSTVTLTKEGTYLLSGSLEDGMVIVDAEKTDKLQVVLNGAEITSSTSAALYVRQADKVFVTLAEGSENTLANGGSYQAIDDNNIDAALFSKDDLTLNGSGSLTVAAGAGHGIVSKDDLVITGGGYQITAAEQGLSGKDSVRIADGIFTITAGKDGIHAENEEDATLGFVYLANGTFNIGSGGDGISAGAYLQADGGTYSLIAGGGSANGTQQAGQDPMPGRGGGGRPQGQNSGTAPEEPPQVSPSASPESAAESTAEDTLLSTKGIKAGGNLLLNDGTYSINAADDALHSNSDLTVNGGSFELSSGDDAVHADAKVTIAGGTWDIDTCYEGIEGQNVEITGGDIRLTASDDGLNAAGGNDQSGLGGGRDQFAEDADASILISGGTLTMTASGDGIDSNGSLTVTGGAVYLSGPENGGNGSLDYAGEAKITGGIFAAAGSSQMAQNFSNSSEQGVILLTVSRQQAGSSVELLDAAGNSLITFTPETQYDCVLLSCPELVQGQSYTVKNGDTETEVAMDSLVYGSGGMNGRPGDMGGQPPAQGGGRQRPQDEAGQPPKNGGGQPPQDGNAPPPQSGGDQPPQDGTGQSPQAAE